jgi:hypothetical protein
MFNVNSGVHKSRATKFCTLVPNICGPSVGNLLRVALLAPRILRLFPDSLKIYEPMFSVVFINTVICLHVSILEYHLQGDHSVTQVERQIRITIMCGRIILKWIFEKSV